MILQSEREQITAACARLLPDGLVVGTAGNLSVRSGDLLAITPSGLPYRDLRPELVCVVEVETGTVVDGPLKPASVVESHRHVADNPIGECRVTLPTLTAVDLVRLFLQVQRLVILTVAVLNICH